VRASSRGRGRDELDLRQGVLLDERGPIAPAAGPDPPLVRRGLIVVDGVPVDLDVRRSARARTLRIIVAPRRPVELVVPRRAGPQDIERFLHEKDRWIRDKVAWARAIAARPSLGLDRRGFVWIGGEPIPVRRVGGRARSFAEIRRGSLEVSGPAERIGDAIDRWYRREARLRISRAAGREAARLGTSYGSLSIRDTTSRWGSCSREGRLSFSWRLVVAPETVMTYVVVHELCHTRVPHHGKPFWRAVADALPGWKEPERWLVEHGTELQDYRPLPPGGP
jgi:predicted metal-dependent hydrolase